MRGTGGTPDFFEGEFVNRFDGLSIPFQTAHDNAKHSSREVNTCKAVITNYSDSSLFLVLS